MSYIGLLKFDDRFARQHRCKPPPEFPHGLVLLLGHSLGPHLHQYLRMSTQI